MIERHGGRMHLDRGRPARKVVPGCDPLRNGPRFFVPIPGTRKLERLEENLGAAAVELTSGDLREIDSAASTVQGARYPEHMERMTGR
jgi:hypothetical protein